MIRPGSSKNLDGQFYAEALHNEIRRFQCVLAIVS